MEPFAIVGLSFRMPQEAVDEDSFWEVLENRKNLMTEWPENRTNLDSFYDAGPQKKLNMVPAFDAPFFSISAREAAAMDPQQRWALEAAYHALESAGIPIETIRGSRTAVYAASFSDDYARMLAKDPDKAPRQTGTGIATSILPNRISWYFDLHGPSIHVDTACSSGLVALDMACQAMRSKDATAALVIGSSLLPSPELTTLLGNMGFLSPDSLCYSFDSRANGFSRGEGIIALVVKPLEEALRNGDVIRAVIRATGSNQDGRTPGLTQPSVEAQESLIRHVYSKAGLPLEETRYFEAHGTGTAVGDPIEIEAIGRAFGTWRLSDDPLYVGSVKTNVGHLEAASGLAGVVKSILTLEKGVIPPNALFEKLNPNIDTDFYNLKIATQCTPWPKPGLRRVSVNSFGFGGTNSHAILDDALHYLQSRQLTGYHHSAAVVSEPNGYTRSIGDDEEAWGVNGNSHKVRGLKLLVFSAADAASLQRMVEAYQSYHSNRIAGSRSKLGQLAWTLAARRSVMAWRTFAIAGLSHEYLENGDQPTNGVSQSLQTEKPVRSSAEKTGTAFVFTGQGAQYVDMGRELLQYATFEESLEKSDGIFASLGCQWSIFDVLSNQERIHSPEISQPLCTALQLALVELLRTFGVIPAAVLGHSSGEIAAAYTIGALSHESACKVAYYRGQVAEKLRRSSVSCPGAMMVVNLAEHQITAFLEEAGLKGNAVHVACINGPTNITLSGPSDAIKTLKSYLDEQGIFAQEIKTGVAYHSPAMRGVSTEYLQLMGSLETGNVNTRLIPMISTVTGRIEAPKLFTTSQYWVENLLSPVRFVDAIRCLEDGMPAKVAITDLVEVGPHSALRRPVRDSVPALRYHTVLERKKSPLVTALQLVGTLFCHGCPVSIAAANCQTRSSSPFLVDCPPYPFDHSKSYWSESRLSKDYRLRPSSPGYLLGKRAHDWNPLVPRWRNWLSTETIPWIEDHIISGTRVCPGTGMVVMALEAVRQVAATKNRPLSGFFFKEAHFVAPIMVGETDHDAVETVVELRPIQKNADEKQSTWFEIHIFSYTDGKWAECFRANIQAQYQETNATKFQGIDEMQKEEIRIRELAETAAESCVKSIDSGSFYQFCEKYGFGYGPSFQLLRDIAYDGDRISCAHIDMAAAGRFYEAVDSPAHPSVLDAAIHMLMTQASRGLSEDLSTLIPKSLANCWVSAKIWDQETSLLRLSSIVRAGNDLVTGIDGSIYALADDGSPLCAIEQLILAEVSQSTTTKDDLTNRKLLHRIAWKPQLSSLSAPELQALCGTGIPNLDETAMMAFYPKIDFAMRAAARKMFKEITKADLDRAPEYIKKYMASLEHEYAGPSLNENDILSDSALEDLLQECEATEPNWRMLTTVARALPSIVRGETDPLELLFSTNVAQAFYNQNFSRHAEVGRLRVFLDLLSHEHPSLRILEVGAGTGAMSRLILETLQSFEQETGQTRFSEYIYTDISAAYFEDARALFDEYKDRMLFKTLDLEIDPAQQGFQLESYDLIIAGGVLHVPSDLTSTLRKVRKLLKPKGHLVFLEVTEPDMPCAKVGFGPIESWWSAKEEWRRYSPLVTEQRWDELLRQTGFSGVDASFRDYESEVCHLSSVMVSTAIDVDNGGNEAEVAILMDPTSDAQYTLATDIKDQYPNAKILHLTRLEEDLPTISSSVVIISLLEVGVPFLANVSGAEFDLLRAHIAGVKDLLWVTSSSHGESGGTAIDPHLAISTGFLRTIRTEQGSKHIVTMTIEFCTPKNQAKYVTQVLRSCFEDKPSSTELEFIVRNDHLVIGRLEHDKNLDSERISHVYPTTISEAWGEGPQLKLEAGVPDTATDLAANEVEIQAAVWPISFRDVFIVLGRLGKEGLGFECAGNVTRMGTACSGKFEIGDRVLMIAPGCMRSHPRASADVVFKIPDDLSFQEAVAGMNPGMTAYHALVNIARLQRGEKVLIHAAAGSTGQMAVKIAKIIGAEIFVTVGSEEKRDLITDPNGLGIPDSHVFYSRNTSFAKGIMRVTGGYGVDVVLNSLSGDGLQASFECVAPYGRFVDIGKSDIMANSSLPMAGFAKNISFASVDLHHIALTNSALTGQLVGKVLTLVGKDGGGPRPLHIYPVSKVEQAIRYMQGGKNTGRIIVTLGNEDVVSKYVVRKRTWRFDADATYIVVGGLGGLGRTIVGWMAEKGAKNLILLSRSGASSQAASQLISGLTERDINVVAPRCDVSSAEELSTLLKDCAHLPPIKGCINAAMDLQDAIFENMTYEQWSRTIKSKVHSSWNLHQLLPQDMDFFILLSSLAGIYGSGSQCNYAAGNTFQDSLARMRTASGLRNSVALDLGWMHDIGIIAQRKEYRRYRENTRDMATVGKPDFLALFDHYCDPALPVPATADESQLLVGIVTPTDYYAIGREPVPWLMRPLYAGFDVVRPHATRAKGAIALAKEEPAQLFRQAKKPEERRAIVVDALRNKLARPLGVQPDEIDPYKSLADYGVDSLMAVELRNWIWRDFRATVAVFEIMGVTKMSDVGEIVVERAEE
ncbi:hypothetical protein F5Y04DRAFT_269663 [Hypomontagnella monticulosa]|nr:hypothetical protein F5Y04DRAFT_269663 [Hypomontagnella monticulosa]